MKKSGYIESAIDCPKCDGSAGFHGYRDKTVTTFGGTVTCQRAYYYCRICGQGFSPWDRRVGLQEPSALTRH